MKTYGNIFFWLKDYQKKYSTLLRVYLPYFSSQSQEYLWLWLFAGTLLISNIFQALIFGSINSGVGTFFATMSSSLVSNTQIIQALIDLVKPSVVYVGAILTTAVVRGKLIKQINQLLQKDLGQEWVSSNISYAQGFSLENDQLKEIKGCNKDDKIKYSDFFSHDISKGSAQFVNIFDDFFYKLTNSFVGAYYLLQFAPFIYIPFGPAYLIFPGTLFVGGIFYSILYSVGVSLIGRKLFDISKDNKTNTSAFNNYTSHIEKYAEQIALIKSNKVEYNNFSYLAEKSIENESAINSIQSYLSSFTSLDYLLNMVTSTILCIPQIMARAIQESDLWSISNNFSQFNGILTWPADKYYDLTDAAVIADRTLQAKKQSALWENVLQARNLDFTISNNTKEFSIKGLAIEGNENCDFIMLSRLPRPNQIPKLQFKANKAYAFIEDKLYYIDKTKNKITKLSSNNQGLTRLKIELGFKIDYEHYVQDLSKQKLKIISRHTGHQHDNVILQSTNLTFKQGKIYLVTGENGIGKSTLLRTFSGLWPFAQGKINFPCDEKDIFVLPQQSFIPQNATLYDVIAYPGKCQQKSDRDRIIKILKDLHFDEQNKYLSKADSKEWNNVSGGERQKIAIARILFQQPKIVFLDEPFVGLSPTSTQRAKSMLKKLVAEQGTTILYIDHPSNLQHENSFYDEHYEFKDKALHLQLKQAVSILPAYKDAVRKQKRSMNKDEANSNRRRKNSLNR